MADPAPRHRAITGTIPAITVVACVVRTGAREFDRYAIRRADQ
jgi:hypothetical protein